MPNPETFSPESLDEVAALLLAADDQVRPVPKGTRLLTRVSGSTGPAPIVVDLARVPELNRLDYDERNGLLIGAAVPLVEPLRFAPVRGAYAILVDGIDRGGCDEHGASVTLGESLGASAPTADLAVPLICLGATVAIFGPHGWSEMSVEALCVKRRGVALQPGEFIVDVRLPALSGPSGGAYVRSRTDRGAGGSAGAGAFLVMQEDLETCCGARVTVWTAAGQPLRALDAERFLQGRRLAPDAVEQAGSLATEGGVQSSPTRTAGSPKQALGDVTREAIRRAWERVRARPESDRGARQP